MNIKPIETVYNGYRFRSRLEARWAVFFDELNIKYQYECEGFQLENGELYLPDFYLYEDKIYVEVKPVGAFEIKYTEQGAEFSKDGSKYAYAAKFFTDNDKRYLIVFGDPYTAFIEQADCDSIKSNILFYKGICPIYYSDEKNSVTALCDGEEVKCSNCDHPYTACSTHIFSIMYYDDNKHLYIITGHLNSEDFTIVGYDSIAYLTRKDIAVQKNVQDYYEKWRNAAIKARQARFEHGESP